MKLSSSSKNLFLFLSLFFICFFSVLAKKTYASVSWNVAFNGGNVDSGGPIVHTSDRGYLAAGNTYSFGGGYPHTDTWLNKLNTIGSVEWQKIYGVNTGFIFSDMIATKDGGFLLTGKNNYDDDSLILVIKLDANGEIEWQKKITFPLTGFFIRPGSVVESPDGNFYILFRFIAHWTIITNNALIKIDPNGNTIWTKYIDTSVATHVPTIMKSSHDGGVVVLSAVGSVFNTTDILFSKITSSGNLEWQNTYDGFGNEWLGSIVKSKDGYVVLSKKSKSQHLLFKLDFFGNVIWSKGISKMAFEERNHQITAVKDGGYVFLGMRDVNEPAVVKIDENGDVKFSRAWPGRLLPTSVLGATDGGFLISWNLVGHYYYEGDVTISKYDVDGSSCSSPGYNAGIETYDIDVQVGTRPGKTVELNLYITDADIGVKEVHVEPYKKCISAVPEISVDSSVLSSGYGSVEINDAITKTILIVNEGGIDLDITSVEITGAGAGQFKVVSDCASVIPGTSCTIDLTFAPTFLGEKNAILKIVSNDPDQPAIEIPLSGKGIDTKPPKVSIATDRDLLWPPNQKLVDVLIDGVATDDGSGIASVKIMVADEYGMYDLTLLGFGNAVALEAWRKGTDKDGRLYTLTAVATDKAGNTSSASAQVLVPHDMRK